MTGLDERMTQAEQASIPPTLAVPGLTIRAINWTDPQQVAVWLDLLDHYACSRAGGGKPLRPAVRDALPAQLARRPGTVVLLAWVGPAPEQWPEPGRRSCPDDHHAVGLLNAFEGFSTFAAAPLLNVHDLAVHQHWQRRGIARALLRAAEQEAMARACSKLTLEVLQHNHAARALYAGCGYQPYALDPAMGEALLLQRLL